MKTKKLKILVLGLRGFPDVSGRVEECCEHIYPYIADKGHEVIVFSRSCYTEKKEEYTYKKIRIIPLWTIKHKNLETMIHTFRGTIRALKFKPDIIHYHSIGPSFFVPLAKLLGLKVVATHYGFDYANHGLGGNAKKFLKIGEKHLCKAHEVIVIAKYIQDSILKRFRRESTVIHSGVTLKPVLLPAKYVRHWKLEAKKYFLFTGRFVSKNCIQVLLDAFEKIDTDWKLVIAGDCEQETVYSKQITERGNKMKNVFLTGCIEEFELQEIYSNAGCAVIPFTHAEYPKTLVEALSYGLNVIVSDIPAHHEFNIKQDAIRYFSVYDDEKLKELMEKTIQGELFSSVPLQNRRYIDQNYNWENQTMKLIEVYHELAGRKK